MVAAAILGFEKQKRQIDVEIAELRAMDSKTEPASSKSATAPAKRAKRKMSAATRKAMALAQQKRWAAKRAESEPEATAAKPKRKLSKVRNASSRLQNDTGQRSGLLPRNPRSPSDFLIGESLIGHRRGACVARPVADDRPAWQLGEFNGKRAGTPVVFVHGLVESNQRLART